MSSVAVIPSFIVLAIAIVVPFIVGFYVYQDARRRGMNAILWALVAAAAPGLIGLIVYLLVRGNYSNLRCPNCDAQVKEQFVACPKCGTKLRASCPICATPVEPDWKVCPKCTQPLADVQMDVQIPVRTKDNSIWKVLAIVLIIPILLIAILVLSLSASFSAGSTGVRGVTTNEYYSEMEAEGNSEIADKVKEWVEDIDVTARSAYALQYTQEHESGDQHYFLVYIPCTGEQVHSGVGQSSSIFGTTLTLDVSSVSGNHVFFSIVSSADKVPNLKIMLDGKKLPCEVTTVDYNPTLFFYASESDHSALIDAAGELYVEEIEKELTADKVKITKVTDGHEIDMVEHSEPDFVLNTVVDIHELISVGENPGFLQWYNFSDYFWISIHYSAHYVNGTDETLYTDMLDFWVIEENGNYYLLETLSVNQSDRAPGQIPEPENLTVYQITEERYMELEMLFD